MSRLADRVVPPGRVQVTRLPAPSGPIWCVEWRPVDRPVAQYVREWALAQEIAHGIIRTGRLMAGVTA